MVNYRTQNVSIFMMAIGITIITAIGPYCDAPLQPSALLQGWQLSAVSYLVIFRELPMLTYVVILHVNDWIGAPSLKVPFEQYR